MRTPPILPLFPHTPLLRPVAVAAQPPPHRERQRGAADEHVERVRLQGGSAVGPVEHERSEEHTSELQSRQYLVCRLLLEKNEDVEISIPQTSEIQYVKFLL